MAYNKRNLYQKIVDIQNLYLEHNQKGVTGEFIYSRMVYPVYRISRATFYKYLAINAKRQLHDVSASLNNHEADNRQLNLF